MKRKLLTVLIIIATIFCICSCKDNSTNENSKRKNGRFGYSSEITRINAGNCRTDMMFIDNVFYLSSVRMREDESKVTEIYKLNNENSTVICSMDGDYSFGGYYKDNFLFSSNNGKVILVNTKDYLMTELYTVTNDYQEVIVVDNSIYELHSGSINIVDENGQVLDSLSSEKLTSYSGNSPLFKCEDRLFVITSTGSEDSFIDVDFGTHRAELVFTSTDMGVDIGSFDGCYFTNNKGMYEVDPINLQIFTCALWSDVNIKPESEPLRTPGYYFILDSDHFAKVYDYGTGIIEIQCFTYDESISYEDCEKIVIGGYGASDDLSVMWDAYLFNTTNSDYRVIIEDYSSLFPYNTAEEAVDAKLKLLNYFDEGHTPDIYYGYTFDFDYLYKSGQIIDLSNYLESSKYSHQLSDNTKSLMYKNGSCYRVFSSFVFNGFWSNDEILASNNPSIYDLMQIEKNTSTPIASSEYAPNIMDYIVRYSIGNYINGLWTDEDIKNAIEYSVKHGNSESEPLSNFYGFEDVRDKKCQTTLSFVFDVYDFKSDSYEKNLIYIGYPSINGSAHTADTSGMLAISSTSNNPDACWKVLENSISDDVQIAMLMSGEVPVNNKILDEYLYYAVNPNDLPQDSIYHNCIDTKNPIDKKIADNYKKAVDSIDTVIVLDWGIYNIIREEINNYYFDGKTVDMIVNSLCNRLDTYLSENGIS